MVRVVVSSGVDHQRAVDNVGKFQPGGQYGIASSAVRGYVKGRQVAQVTISPRLPMLFGTLDIKMPTGGQGWHRSAIALGCGTGRIFMNMEAMQSRMQSLEGRIKGQAVGCLHHPNRSQLGTRPLGVDQGDVDRSLGAKRGGGCEQTSERQKRFLQGVLQMKAGPRNKG
jgi:hypothetical protein